jgi:hypothetical protein
MLIGPILPELLPYWRRSDRNSEKLPTSRLNERIALKSSIESPVLENVDQIVTITTEANVGRLSQQNYGSEAYQA